MQNVDYFCLLRSDKERVADHQSIRLALEATGRSVESRDWLEQRPGFVASPDRRHAMLSRRYLRAATPFRHLAIHLCKRYAMQRMTCGIGLLSRGSTIVTDRLHAHIMSVLLKTSNMVFDSYDGKISSFHNTWLRNVPNSQFVSSAANLRRILR